MFDAFRCRILVFWDERVVTGQRSQGCFHDPSAEKALRCILLVQKASVYGDAKIKCYLSAYSNTILLFLSLYEILLLTSLVCI